TFQSSFFFYSCYTHHRDLHSFPTRRSSDLIDEEPHEKETFYLGVGDENGTSSSTPSDEAALTSENMSIVSGSFTEEIAIDKDERSEEHTSELQSRFDLVCRLLLEKKKKTKK